MSTTPFTRDNAPTSTRTPTRVPHPVTAPCAVFVARRRSGRAHVGAGHAAPGQEQPGLEHGVRIERDALDPLLDQPLRQVRMVRRTLTANTDIFALLAASLDRALEE